MGAGAQVISAIQPGFCTEGSLLKTNVKHQSGVVEVNGPGRLAPVKLPQNPPAKPPGT